jgi:hypothetical protein
VTALRVYRSCIPASEACATGVVPGDPTAPVVYLGDAVFLAGARPDVAAAFPTYPQANRAGFGAFVLSNLLPRTTGVFQPNGGQGPLTIYAIAYDADNNATLLGRVWNTDHTPTTVAMDNDNIAKPFGVIDTPIQGGETSTAASPNFGWALTPDDGSRTFVIPLDGSTMFVFVDGVSIGNVTYNQCRGDVGNPPPPAIYCNDDVSSIFGNATPQPPLKPRTTNPSRYMNLNAGRGPQGSFAINTMAYANGLHSIAWSVTDNHGRIDGLGSRLFTVNNPAQSLAALANTALINPELGRRVADLGVLTPTTAAVGQRLGPARDDEFIASTRRTGRVEVRAVEQERIELALPASETGEAWQGYVVQNGSLHVLPIGASLDPAGRFYWQSVAGFYGSYDLLFIRDHAGSGREMLPVRVTFVPKFKAAR